MDNYTCEICSQSVLLWNKNRHEKSKKHLKNIENNRECPICYENKGFLKNKKNNIHCQRCKNTWCKSCDEKINKCPFCRTNIREEEVKAEEKNDDIVNIMVEYILEYSMNIAEVIRSENMVFIFRNNEEDNDTLILDTIIFR